MTESNLIVQKILRQSIQRLKNKDHIDDPGLEARLFIQAVTGYSPEDLILHRDIELSQDQIDRLNQFIDRRLVGEPVAKILSRREFYSRPFITTDATLDPRPDSEAMIDAALAIPPAGRILDLGTGTGCLIITMLCELGGAHGVAVDRSLGAARVAQKNAIRHGVNGRLNIIVGDWATAIAGEFDLILCNPPYIPSDEFDRLSPSVRDYDPRGALIAGKDGLIAYRRIIPDLSRILSDDGYALVEIGHKQASDVRDLFISNGFRVEKTIPDLAARDRVLMARLDNT
jgi:release factor glutamine methyltransferase